jgi:hypothetical protein
MGQLAGIAEALILIAKAIKTVVDAAEELQKLFYEGALTELQVKAVKKLLSGAFDTIQKSICLISLDEYNKVIEQTSLQYEGLPAGFLPAWWKKLTPEEYESRRNFYECPVPKLPERPQPAPSNGTAVARNGMTDMLLIGGSLALAAASIAIFLLKK